MTGQLPVPPQASSEEIRARIHASMATSQQGQWIRAAYDLGFTDGEAAGAAAERERIHSDLMDIVSTALTEQWTAQELTTRLTEAVSALTPPPWAASEAADLLDGTAADAEAEREFLTASIAVWREIDRLDSRPEGYRPTGMDIELRRAERAAWERYRDLLDGTAGDTCVEAEVAGDAVTIRIHGTAGEPGGDTP